MSSPLPLRTNVEHSPTPSESHAVTAPGTDGLFDALSCRTARRILAALGADAQTPSGLADRVDTSLQNVQYHLEKLVDADLVTEVDTWYSSRGKEMSVYAATTERVTLRLESDAAPTASDAPATAPATVED